MNDRFSILIIKKPDMKRIKRNGYTLCSRFMYGGNDLYLVSSDKQYDICIKDEENYISVWHNPLKHKNGEVMTQLEVKSLFRDGYTKNKITKNDIKVFIENPKEYQNLRGHKK